jgi:hypothetical protein
MIKRLVIFFIICLISIQAIHSQDSISYSNIKKKQSYRTDSSHWTIEIPIWIPGFRGEFAYGDVELEGEDGTVPVPEHPIEPPKFGDALKRIFNTKGSLNYFFIGSFSYTNKRFYSELDLFSGTVGEKLKFIYNNNTLVGAKIHTDLFRLNAGYTLLRRPVFSEKADYLLYGYGGIRFHNFKIESNLDNIGKTLKIDPLWIEPIVGLNNVIKIDYWQFVAQADMGSFGIEDKFSYQLNLFAFYRISNLLSVKAGWNSWYSNYHDRFKNEDLVLKIHLAGPVAGLVFNF